MIASTQTNQPFSDTLSQHHDFVTVATAKLKGAGLRVTSSRLKLLHALARSDRPLSIEELHATLAPSSCDIVTVYRCMVAFEELDLVRRTYRYRGTTLYERKAGLAAPYRVVCKLTEQTEALPDSSAQRLAEVMAAVEAELRTQGYAHVSHVVEFFGIRKSVVDLERGCASA